MPILNWFKSGHLLLGTAALKFIFFAVYGFASQFGPLPEF